MARKSVVLFLFGLQMHLYTTFVLMSLWNWFAVPTFHVPEISFWLMYGLVLIVSLFRDDNDDLGDNQHFKVLTTMIEACIPADRVQDVKSELDDQAQSVWVEGGFMIAGRAFANTITLGVGFVVHLLASL